MPITLSELAKLQRKKNKKKNKYNATQIFKKEIRFDSKLEAEYYEWLLKEKEAGNVLYFLRQVPFHLPAQIKYLVDFQIFMKSGSVIYVDVKGVMTDVSRNKIKQVVNLYPINIQIFTKNNPYHISEG